MCDPATAKNAADNVKRQDRNRQWGRYWLEELDEEVLRSMPKYSRVARANGVHGETQSAAAFVFASLHSFPNPVCYGSGSPQTMGTDE